MSFTCKKRSAAQHLSQPVSFSLNCGGLQAWRGIASTQEAFCLDVDWIEVQLCIKLGIIVTENFFLHGWIHGATKLSATPWLLHGKLRCRVRICKWWAERRSRKHIWESEEYHNRTESHEVYSQAATEENSHRWGWSRTRERSAHSQGQGRWAMPFQSLGKST